VPVVVWAAQALFLVLLVTYTQLSPTYRAPDEVHHVDLVVALAEGEPYPPPDVRDLGRGVIVTKEVVGYADQSRNLLETDAPDRAERPSIADAGGSTPSGQYNQATQHPQLYYRVAAAWLDAWRAIVDVDAFDRTVGALRLLSVLLVLPLPLLSYATARRLGGDDAVATSAALVPVAVPQLIHIGAVTNNDALLIGLLALMAYLVARLLTGERGWPVPVALGAAAAASLLTKGLALAVMPWLVVVVLVVWARAAPDERTGVAIRSGVAAAIAAIGGLWWVQTWRDTGELLPGGLHLPPAPEGFRPERTEWIRLFFSRMTFKFWGHIGPADVRFPFLPVALGTVALLGGIGAGLILRRPAPRRSDLAILLLPFPLLLAFVALGAHTRYLETAQTPGIQGRYLFGAIVGMAVCFAAGATALAGRFRVWVPVGVAVAAVAMHAYAVVRILDFYWGAPDDSWGGRLGALGAWSPWFDALPVLLLGLAGIAAVVLVLVAVAGARRPAGDPLEGVPIR
jgi:4-amino-4-deoxy-L-arabinose transferase-like glycosyltransferase